MSEVLLRLAIILSAVLALGLALGLYWRDARRRLTALFSHPARHQRRGDGRGR